MGNGQKKFQQLLEKKQPILTAWKHFIEVENNPIELAKKTIAFQKKYQWDLVKINPRATYYAEAFGNKYNINNYTDVLPELVDYPLKTSQDLTVFGENYEINFQPFEDQILVAKEVRKGLGDQVPIIQTLFSPLCILTFLSGHNPYPGAPAPINRSASELNRLLKENPTGVLQALEIITNVLLEYIDLTLNTGIDGFFYSLFGHGNITELRANDYEKFSLPFDQILFDAIHKKKGVTMLHTCGSYANPERFAAIPHVDILHWADNDPGNPSLQPATWLKDKIPAGGVDQRLFSSTETREITLQAQRAIQQRANAPLILTAGCGLPVETTEAALWALRKSVY